MKFRLKPLAEQVVVVTGASSGIGLATACAAAARGAKVVLAARNADALAQVVAEIEQEGHKAIAVPTDVGERTQIEHVADEAIARYGRIDTWVNNAGVDIWGRLEQVTEEDNRRLFDTNFWGTVNGSLIAARHMKTRGGAIINLGSLASDRAFPLQGIYSASKHAIKGFTDALRMELEEEGAGISVTLIKPAAIGTPLQRQAKNYLAHEPRLPSPLYTPEQVAAAILHAAERPQRDIYVGSVSKAMSFAGINMPRLMDHYSERSLFKTQMRDSPSQARRDNLHASGPGGGTVRDDPEGRPMRDSMYTRLSIWPSAAATAASLCGLTVLALATQLRSRH